VSDVVSIEYRTPAVAVLTINRPDRRNALSIEVRDSIAGHLDRLATDPDLKVVVLTGAGDLFCAGFDLKEFERAASDAAFGTELWASSARYHHAVATFPLIAIAAVNGPAIAGGFDLAVLCDIRIASTTARFAHPEYTFGDVVYAPLRDLVGGSLARDLCLTGRTLDATEALAAHLVSQVVAPESVLDSAVAMAEQVSRAPRANLIRSKQNFITSGGQSTL
jgi:enoyl-CoA hydratase/carnithine racemase